jgi:hypothetical protein
MIMCGPIRLTHAVQTPANDSRREGLDVHIVGRAQGSGADPAEPFREPVHLDGKGIRPFLNPSEPVLDALLDDRESALTEGLDDRPTSVLVVERHHLSVRSTDLHGRVTRR